MNKIVRKHNVVSLADPIGLYIHHIELTSFETPDGSSILEWVHYARGVEGFRTRVTFEAPAGSGLTLSDLTVDGAPLEFGGQIAERVEVRVNAMAAPTKDNFDPIECGSPESLKIPSIEKGIVQSKKLFSRR